MRLALLAAAAAVLSASAALAAPITFVFTGSGSGTLDGTAFGPSAFTITLQGDTANRAEPLADIYDIDPISGAISINGLGTYSFVTPLRVFSNTSMGGVGVASSGEVLGLDLYDVDGIFGWDMLSDASYTDVQGNLMQWDATPIETSGGVLFFGNNSVPATFSATVVPEPSSVALIGLGVAALLRRTRVGV